MESKTPFSIAGLALSNTNPVDQNMIEKSLPELTMRSDRGLSLKERLSR